MSELETILQNMADDSMGMEAGDRQVLSEAADRIRELEAKNIRLRKIAAHVPSKIYIKAKEIAGFGVPIKALQDKAND